MFKGLKKAFATCAQRIGIGRNLPNADVILVAEVYGEVGGPVLAAEFIDFRLANGSNGFVLAGQDVFNLQCKTRIDLTSLGSFEGLRLHYVTEE